MYNPITVAEQKKIREKLGEHIRGIREDLRKEIRRQILEAGSHNIHSANWKKYSQKWVAEQLRLEQPSISRYESGGDKIDIYTLIGLADIYGVSVKDLIPDNLREKKNPIPRVSW
jgi:predicted XRE-type DNA-binding protein